MLTIWHNPRCTKSRLTLAMVEESGLDYTMRLYLDDRPTPAEIKSMVERLGFDHPQALIRTCEEIYKELGLKDVSDANALLEAMSSNPILIERPIVSDGTRAFIGRPPELVKPLLEI